jgi:predicted Zn-dependent protease
LSRGFELCDRVFEQAARAAPGAEAIVSVRRRERGHVRFAVNEVTQAGEVSATEVRLTLAFGKRHAKAETNQTDAAARRARAARTAALARVAPEDPEWLPVLGPQRYATSPHGFDAATVELPAKARTAGAAAAIRRAEEKSLVAAGFYESAATLSAFATSAGLRAEHRETVASLTTTVRTADGAGSGWAGAEEVRAADVDADALARVAADKAERSHGARKLDPGKYTVLLEPMAVADILGFLIEALDARAADEGRSFFSKAGGGNRIGESILDPRVTLRSNPFDPATPGRPWDDDGLPLAPTTWIDGGALKNLYYSRFWAHKSGNKPTGGHSTWQLAGGVAPSAASLVAGIKRGLVVTRFWYTRWLDPKAVLITGLTRDGVFLVEDGKVTGPVNNFRFNESPVKVLSKLVGMTAQTYRVPWWGGVMRVPAVCCEEFAMASTSEAV